MKFYREIQYEEVQENSDDVEMLSEYAIQGVQELIDREESKKSDWDTLQVMDVYLDHVELSEDTKIKVYENIENWLTR